MLQAKLEPIDLKSFEPPTARKFVWRQLELMDEGMSRRDAFDQVERELAVAVYANGHDIVLWFCCDTWLRVGAPIVSFMSCLPCCQGGVTRAGIWSPVAGSNPPGGRAAPHRSDGGV